MGIIQQCAECGNFPEFMEDKESGTDGFYCLQCGYGVIGYYEYQEILRRWNALQYWYMENKRG
jgi:hypothetical protein